MASAPPLRDLRRLCSFGGKLIAERNVRLRGRAPPQTCKHATRFAAKSDQFIVIDPIAFDDCRL
jgi:hypothetical protein